LGTLEKDSTQSEKRFQTLHACFDYTINSLDTTLQQLLHRITLFRSPFPLSAAVEIFSANENEILDLYDRSLLTLVDSDERYGKVEDPDYWLYNFHPAVKNYVVGKWRKTEGELETKYGVRYSTYYYNLLQSTDSSIGTENHVPSFARFNIILQGEYNDFERATELTDDEELSAGILRALGLLVYGLGMLTKAKGYLKKSLEIHESLNDRVGMGGDYTNIGLVLSDMGDNQRALEYHNKSLEIREGLNDRVGIASNYHDISLDYDALNRRADAVESINKGLSILSEFEEKSGYHHHLIEELKQLKERLDIKE
jgi:tetratricopeptide (TPR) repeat protein